MDELQAAVLGHALGELFGGLEAVELVNGVGGFGFLVADVNEPDGDFVTVAVLVGLRAVEKDAAPFAGGGGGGVAFKGGVAHGD